MSTETPEQIAERICRDQILLTQGAFERSIAAAIRTERAQSAMVGFPKFAAELDAAGGVDAVIARKLIHEKPLNAALPELTKALAKMTERAEKAERELAEAEKIIKEIAEATVQSKLSGAGHSYALCHSHGILTQRWLERRKQAQTENNL